MQNLTTASPASNTRKPVTDFGTDELATGPYVVTFRVSDGLIGLCSAEVVQDREWLRLNGLPAETFVPGMSQADYDAQDFSQPGAEWTFCQKHNAFPIPRKPVHADDIDAVFGEGTADRLTRAVEEHLAQEWAEGRDA